jgi:glycosyltransferase involved in cell wall biosynthesis
VQRVLPSLVTCTPLECWLQYPAQALASAAVKLIDDRIFRAQTGAQARSYVTRNYRFVDMIDAYQEVLNIA